jgi:hypothetical protein
MRELYHTKDLKGGGDRRFDGIYLHLKAHDVSKNHILPERTPKTNLRECAEYRLKRVAILMRLTE